MSGGWLEVPAAQASDAQLAAVMEHALEPFSDPGEKALFLQALEARARAEQDLVQLRMLRAYRRRSTKTSVKRISITFGAPVTPPEAANKPSMKAP